MVIIGLFHTDILPGDFLIAQKAGTKGLSHVGMCRVQRSLDNEQLEIVWWEKSEVAPPSMPCHLRKSSSM